MVDIKMPKRTTKKKAQKKKSGKDVKKKVRKEKKEVEKKVSKRKGEQEEKVIYARERYLPISPRKARLVIDMVRGQNAVSAVHELSFVRKKAALMIKKAVESAVANAVNNFEMDKKKLVIVEAFVDGAPTYKRGRAGSRGRYKKILKPNSHITIGVAQK